MSKVNGPRERLKVDGGIRHWTVQKRTRRSAELEGSEKH